MVIEYVVKTYVTPKVKKISELVVVVHAYSVFTWEVERSGVQGHPQVVGLFEAPQG